MAVAIVAQGLAMSLLAKRNQPGKRLVLTSQKSSSGGVSMAGDLFLLAMRACIVHHHAERSSQCTRVVDCSVVFHCRLAVSPRILCGTCTRASIVDTCHAMRT
jgi:hypothetical protein